MSMIKYLLSISENKDVLSWKNIDVNEDVLSRKAKMSMSMCCLEKQRCQ